MFVKKSKSKGIVIEYRISFWIQLYLDSALWQYYIKRDTPFHTCHFVCTAVSG